MITIPDDTTQLWFVHGRKDPFPSAPDLASLPPGDLAKAAAHWCACHAGSALLSTAALPCVMRRAVPGSGNPAVSKLTVSARFCTYAPGHESLGAPALWSPAPCSDAAMQDLDMLLAQCCLLTGQKLLREVQA